VALGHDTLVLADGPDTYQIDLEALFKHAPMESVYTAFRIGFRIPYDKSVIERIEESRRKDAERRD
jgi:hypothetical protein